MNAEVLDFSMDNENKNIVNDDDIKNTDNGLVFNPYNSLKLFRQTKFNYWEDTINDIYNQLKYLIRQQEAHKFKIKNNK